MDRKIVLYVLGAVALGFIGFMMMIPEERNNGVVRLPWLVTVDPRGRTQVFGFRIGETTLADIRDALGEEGEINLFSHPAREDRYFVEVYFDQIYLEGLRADFVITLDAGQEPLKAMYERGLRISQLGSGGKKVKLAPADIDALKQHPIRAITYLPWKSLDAEILKNRFGEPTRMLREDTGVTHWLYPAKGMDIGLDENGGVVIQYVNPAEFAAIMAPLLNPSGQSEPTQQPPALEATASPGSP